MNKLGINLWNWCPALSDKCLGLPTRIARMGFDAVELPMTVAVVDERLKNEIKDNGLEVSLCAALGPGRDISNFNEDIRESTMTYLTECLKTGESLGAKVLAGPLYAGGGKRHALPDDEKAREWDYAVQGLSELARRASDCGIRLAIEPLHRYRTSVINTVGQALKMIDDIGAINVGLHYDTFHACLEEADLIESLNRALASRKVMHFHACANNRGAPGQGIVPWGDVFTAIRKSGYRGHVTMETFAPGGLDAGWVNVHGSPDEVARIGITCLRQFFS